MEGSMMAIQRGFRWYAHGILCSITLLCLVFLPCMGTMTTAADEKPWYPVAVDVWQPPFNEMRQRVQKMYVPLEKAQRKWRISAFIPHLKDAYWRGVNYGLIDEARRLGVSLSIYEAGGYGRLGVQREQIEEMLSNNTNKPDGLIIAAISQDGLNDIVKKAHGLGIPVVDLINGLSSPLISARAAATFWDNGYQTGMYLQRIQEKTGKPMRVAWFPGPKGAGWVAAGSTGFNEAITGGDIKIMCTSHGDTGAAVQGKLVEIALDQHGDNLDFIVGTAATTEASVKILRKRGLSNQIKLLSYYYGPSVHRGIRRGRILAAPTDSQVLQARIALDILVRILEKKDYFKHAAPRVMVVDRDNIRTWDSSTTLSPRGFRPVFSIN
jgi:periplasmic protein TorT